MRAKARESRGQGNADAQVHMALTSDNGKTRGKIDTDVKLSGKAAAMGGGVIKEVSGKLVDQFAKNLAEMLGAGSPGTQPDARGGRRRRPGDADRRRADLVDRQGLARPADADRGRRGRSGDADARSRRPRTRRSTSGASSAR